MTHMLQFLSNITVKMSSVNINSSYSTTSDIQVRYHKAIKQISKLININTGLKKQSDYFKNACNQLQNQINHIKNQLNNRHEQCNFLASQNRAILNDKQKLEDMINNDNNRNNFDKNQQYEALAQQKSNLQEQNEGFKHKIQSLLEKLETQGQVIMNLQDRIGARGQQNKQLTLQIQSLNQRIKTMQIQNKAIQKINLSSQTQKVMPYQCINCKSMRDKIQSIREWSIKIDQQNIALKKKSILDGNQILKYGYSTAVKNCKSGSPFSFKLMQALEDNARQMSIHKKQQNLKLKKKLNNKIQEVEKLKGQNLRLQKRIVALQSFIEKQRTYLQQQAQAIQQKLIL